MKGTDRACSLQGVEMRGIAYADGTVAAEILLALAENNVEARGE